MTAKYKERQTEVVSVRMTKEDKARLGCFAERDDRTLGAFIRRAALEKADALELRYSMGSAGELFDQLQEELKKQIKDSEE